MKSNGERRRSGALGPRDVVNTDDPAYWAARFGSRPGERLLCPRAAAEQLPDSECPPGPHVHDRTGAAHPVTPDGRWAINRPTPPAPRSRGDATTNDEDGS